MAGYEKKRPLPAFTRRLRLPMHRRHARRTIERASSRPAGFDALVDASLDLDTRGLVEIQARQIRSEIRALAAAVAELKPRNVVEIGTFRGGTLWFWTHLTSRRVITCDFVQKPPFHGIAPRQPFPKNQVQHLWAEPRSRFNVEEFVDHPEQLGHGIGVVRKAG